MSRSKHVVSLGDHAISRGFSVPRCLAGATYSVDIDDVYKVGDAAVFLEPPAARHRYLLDRNGVEGED